MGLVEGNRLSVCGERVATGQRRWADSGRCVAWLLKMVNYRRQHGMLLHGRLGEWTVDRAGVESLGDIEAPRFYNQAGSEAVTK